jgi:hypothetical protein
MEVGMPDAILRWLQYMSTFDIEVEYRPGTHHGNADGLSRPPPTDCGKQGCICVQACTNMGGCLEAADGEPDSPGVPAPASKLIAVVTRSGRLIGDKTEPELDSGVEVTVGLDSDPWVGPMDGPDEPENLGVRLDISDEGLGNSHVRPDEGEAAKPDYSSDSTEGDESEEEVRSDDDSEPSHGPDYSWSSEGMRGEQDEDDTISRVRAWVAMGAKPSPEE